MYIAKPSGMTPSQYAKDLLTKSFRCKNLYEGNALNEILIKGFDASIRHSMRKYKEGKKEASLHDIAFHATTLLELQGHDWRSNCASQFTKKAADKMRETVVLLQISRECRSKRIHIEPFSFYEKNLGYSINSAGYDSTIHAFKRHFLADRKPPLVVGYR